MSAPSWPVDRIADVYEIVASLNEDPEERRAAAFVAGTAQQIIARRIGVASETVPLPVDRDGVDAGLAAALLFLAAEQYADANEAAGPLALPRSGMEEAREIGRHVRDFARGNLPAILDRAAAAPIRAPSADGLEAMPASVGALEEIALRLLLGQIVTGIEHLAAYVMSANEAPAGDLQAARALFQRVLALASRTSDYDLSLDDGAPVHFTSRYPGPAHLASLLLSVTEGIADAPLTRLPPPDGADPEVVPPSWTVWRLS